MSPVTWLVFGELIRDRGKRGMYPQQGQCQTRKLGERSQKTLDWRKKSFPSVRKWDVASYCRQSENASLQIRSTGNTTAETNAQAAEGQDHSEKQQKS